MYNIQSLVAKALSTKPAFMRRPPTTAIRLVPYLSQTRLAGIAGRATRRVMQRLTLCVMVMTNVLRCMCVYACDRRRAIALEREIEREGGWRERGGREGGRESVCEREREREGGRERVRERERAREGESVIERERGGWRERERGGREGGRECDRERERGGGERERDREGERGRERGRERGEGERVMH